MKQCDETRARMGGLICCCGLAAGHQGDHLLFNPSAAASVFLAIRSAVAEEREAIAFQVRGMGCGDVDDIAAAIMARSKVP
jgi:hypothetical protein